MTVIALILAGARETLLRPLSREAMPEQFISPTGDRTLLQKTCLMVRNIIPFERQWIITGEAYRGQVVSQLEALSGSASSSPSNEDMKSFQVLTEPSDMNTAPAIFWAAFRCYRAYGPNSTMLVLPSEHPIADESPFINTISLGISEAQKGRLITFGITPTQPETIFGYIKYSRASYGSEPSLPVKAFIEKPDKPSAQNFLDDGNYLWNSEIFVFNVGKLLEEGKKYCREIYELFSQFNPYDPEDVQTVYENLQPQSIDCALMKHTRKAYVIPYSFH